LPNARPIEALPVPFDFPAVGEHYEIAGVLCLNGKG